MLFKCPDCKKEISMGASRCPNCGKPEPYRASDDYTINRYNSYERREGEPWCNTIEDYHAAKAKENARVDNLFEERSKELIGKKVEFKNCIEDDDSKDYFFHTRCKAKDVGSRLALLVKRSSGFSKVKRTIPAEIVAIDKDSITLRFVCCQETVTLYRISNIFGKKMEDRLHSFVIEYIYQGGSKRYCIKD